MLHDVLIGAHAFCGLAALALGAGVVRPRAIQRAGPLFQWYLGTLWLMVLFLIVVVAIDWAALDLTARIIYSALSALAVYTGWRGWYAWQDLTRQASGWRSAYVDDVGFTLIALFDGFVIVSALDLGTAPWLVVLVGILGVLVGRLGLDRVKARAASTPISLGST